MGGSKVIFTIINITLPLLLAFILINDTQVNAKRKFSCERCKRICNKPGKTMWTFCSRCDGVCDNKGIYDPWIYKSLDTKRKFNGTEGDVPAAEEEGGKRIAGRSIDGDANPPPISGSDWWG